MTEKKLCPYCNKKMQKGRIGSERSIYYIPGDKGFYFNKKRRKLKSNKLTIASIDAFYCKYCNKIIVEENNN